MSENKKHILLKTPAELQEEKLSKLSPEERAKAEAKNKKRAGIFGTILILVIILTVGSCIRQCAISSKEPDTFSITNSSFDGSVFVCKEYLRTHLNDWDSYQSVSWSKVVETPEGLLKTTNTFRAKNAFGGLILKTCAFTYTKQGTVISAEIH